MKVIFNCAGWINFRKLINTLYLFASLFHQLMFYNWYLHYTICISGITHYVSKYHLKSIFNAHWKLFWSKSSLELSPEFRGISFKIYFQCSLKLILIKKFHGTFSRVPWKFLNNIWTTPVVPWNSIELEQQNLKFHGIPWNCVQIQSSMEFHGTFFNTSEFHGITWNSMELSIFPQKVPW